MNFLSHKKGEVVIWEETLLFIDSVLATLLNSSFVNLSTILA